MKLPINTFTASKNACFGRKWRFDFIIFMALVIVYLQAFYLKAQNYSIHVVTRYVAESRPDQCESSWENSRKPSLQAIFGLDAVFTKLNISYVVSDGTALAVARQSAINPWERVKYQIFYIHAKKKSAFVFDFLKLNSINILLLCYR